MEVEFLVMILAGCHWQVNPMAGRGISGNPTSRILLGNKSHGWTWNFWYCYWLDFTGK